MIVFIRLNRFVFLIWEKATIYVSNGRFLFDFKGRFDTRANYRRENRRSGRREHAGQAVI